MTSTTNATAFLRTLDLFSDLSDREIEELALTAVPFERSAGGYLFHQGDVADAMYGIEEGTVRITVRMAGEEEVELVRVGAGAVVGEMGLVDADVRSASAAATEALSGYRIDAAAFDVLRAAFRPSSCKVVRRLAELISSRIRATTLDLYGAADAPALNDADRSPPVSSSRRHRQDPDLDHLLCLPIFGAFARDEMADLLGEMDWLEVPRGCVIFETGDAPDACYVVTRGAVEATRFRGGGHEKIALWGPGRMVGEQALFSSEPRDVRATAREDCHLLRLEVEPFRRLFDETSTIAFKLSDAATQQMVVALRNLNRRRTWLTAHRGGRFHFFK
ncbi:MAG: cyclic nucleotide-binding domain-containing protein [Rhodothermales bacterium]